MTTYRGININAMYQRALNMHNVTVQHTDLMTDEEATIYNNMHTVYQDDVRLVFMQLLMKNNMDQLIVPSIYLNDSSIRIY